MTTPEQIAAQGLLKAVMDLTSDTERLAKRVDELEKKVTALSKKK